MLFSYFLLVLFPFFIPLLGKMNVTLLPSEVMDFFMNVFIKMKKEREKHSGMVSPAQVAFPLRCAALLSAGGTWQHLQKLWYIC